MKKSTTPLILLFIIIIVLFMFTGCGASETIETVDNTNIITTIAFNHSEGIDDNGYWVDINALDYVELCEYENILVPSDIRLITDEAVQTEIDTILSGYVGDKQVTDRTVANNDTVNIDYVGSVDGMQFDGGSTDATGTEVTIGVTEYIDDFLEQLIGHTPGESFDIEVTFPEDYGNEELNGKDAKFAIKINYIVEKITPELTDEFVLENLSSDYNWSTITEMKAGIKSDLQNSAMASYIQEYIVENTAIVSLPEALVEYQKNTMLNYYQNYASYYGMNIEEFLSSYVGVATIDELFQANKANITERAELYLIIQAIGEDTGISVSEEDVAALINNYADSDD
jgi:trigger factor